MRGTLGSGVLVYFLLWGVFVWVRSLGLGLLRLELARILVVGLPRVKRPIVLRRTRKSACMLILSGRLI